MSESTSAAPVWSCGAYDIDLVRPVVMGILNVTPDSFSDGGAHAGFDEAVAHAQLMLSEGADIIDVGGESTRPGSDEVVIDEELARVLPVVRALAEQGTVVSIDTRHAQVAAACVEAGAAIINDVSGFRDEEMVRVAVGCDAGLIVMHMAGEPKSMQDAPTYGNVSREVGAYLRNQAQMLEAAGIERERICIDPGPGFGKTTEHNLELLRATSYLASFGYPLMVATSRKRFIGAVTGVEVAAERVSGSVATAAYAIEHGAHLCRVHDVAATVEALKLLFSITTTQTADAWDACGPVVRPAGSRAPVRAAAPVERRVYLGLGSNQGDRLALLQDAVRAIADIPGVALEASSRVYESEPAYFDDQPAFANAVIAIRTALEPLDLLGKLQEVELGAGRLRAFDNCPRTLDVDVLDVVGVSSSDPVLTLPHPKLLERDFVVTPLLECAARLGDEHPVLANGMPVTRAGIAYGAVTGTIGDLAAG